MTHAALAAAVLLALGGSIATPPGNPAGTPPASPPPAEKPPAGRERPAIKPPPSVPVTPRRPNMNTDQPVNTLSAKERADGWVLLFDGTQSGIQFRGYRKETLPEGWSAVEGSLVRTGPGGDIVTREQYKDFEFVCDWKVQKAGNSGVMWHVSEERTYPWETGPEMQILDDAGHVDGRTPLTSAGACYALYAAPEGAVKPAGEWNHARIVAKGPKVELWLNGVQTASFDTSSDDWKARIAASKFKEMPLFATKESGFIALQDHGDEVAFRNIKVRPLK